MESNLHSDGVLNLEVTIRRCDVHPIGLCFLFTSAFASTGAILSRIKARDRDSDSLTMILSHKRLSFYPLVKIPSHVSSLSGSNPRPCRYFETSSLPDPRTILSRGIRSGDVCPVTFGSNSFCVLSFTIRYSPKRNFSPDPVNFSRRVFRLDLEQSFESRFSLIVREAVHGVSFPAGHRFLDTGFGPSGSEAIPYRIPYPGHSPPGLEAIPHPGLRPAGFGPS